MPSVKVSILRTLLGHANPSTPANLRPWVHPPTFGENSSYTTLARCADAGTTPEELDKLGLGIQGESLNRQRETQGKGDTPAKLDRAEERRAVYRSAGHPRMVAYTVNPSTSPSGLRPASIPATARADQMTAWHAALSTAVANATGDTVELPPLVIGDGTSMGAAASSPRAPRASGPFARFQGLRTLLGSVVSDINNALETCDAPELVASPRSMFVAWALTCPTEELDKVTADAFDATTIRVASAVTFVDGSPAAKAAAFKLKGAGATYPESFVVDSIVEGVATLLHPDPTVKLKAALTATLPQLRRYVAPVTVAPVDPKLWKATVDGFATFDGQEVLVLSLGADDDATILDGNGEEQTVALEFLSAPAA